MSLYTLVFLSLSVPGIQVVDFSNKVLWYSDSVDCRNGFNLLQRIMSVTTTDSESCDFVATFKTGVTSTV